MRARIRGDVLWLVAILAAFGAVSFLTLGLQSYDSGETITAGRVIHSSYLDTFNAFATTERSGPVYYSLAWAWSRLFGVGEVGLRSLSLLATLGTIAAMYFAGRELLGRRAGVLAALLAACNPDIFWFSQEARSYPFYMFFSALGIYFFIRALKRPSRGAYAGWALAGCLGLATHYFSAFFFGLEAIVLVVAAGRRQRAPLWAGGAFVLTGLALLPLAIHQERAGRVNAFHSVPVLERGASALVKFAAGQMTHPAGALSDIPPAARIAGPVILALLAGSILLLFIRTRGETRRLAGAVGLVAGLGFGIPIVMALVGFDYVEPYNLDGALPLLLLLAAGGVDVAIGRVSWATPRGLAPAAALALPMAGMIAAISLFPSLQRENWRGVSRAVQASGPAGLILTNPPEIGTTLSYYLGHSLHGVGSPNYPCGVATRRIIAVTAAGQTPPAYGFKLRATRVVNHRWTVSTYVSARPMPLDAARIETLGIVGSGDAAFVDSARPVTALPPAAPAARRLDRLATMRTPALRDPGSGPCDPETARLARTRVSRGTKPPASRGRPRSPRGQPLRA